MQQTDCAVALSAYFPSPCLHHLYAAASMAAGDAPPADADAAAAPADPFVAVATFGGSGNGCCTNMNTLRGHASVSSCAGSAKAP